MLPGRSFYRLFLDPIAQITLCKNCQVGGRFPIGHPGFYITVECLVKSLVADLDNVLKWPMADDNL